MVRICYEDNHLIAAVKQSGQTVQPEPGKPECLEDQVKKYIKQKYEKQGDVFLGVIHRIDMPVSGLVLFARTSKALTRMNEIFKDREVKKIYRTWVEGKPPLTHDLLTHYLRRDEHKNFTKAFTSEVKGAQLAQLKYTLVQTGQQKSLLEVELLSGRKHQIRAQLSAIGCPILGDYKYGAQRAFSDQHIELQSFSLAFEHPVKKEWLEISLGSNESI